MIFFIKGLSELWDITIPYINEYIPRVYVFVLSYMNYLLPSLLFKSA